MILWLQNRRNKIILGAIVGVLIIGGVVLAISVKKGWLKPRAEEFAYVSFQISGCKTNMTIWRNEISGKWEYPANRSNRSPVGMEEIVSTVFCHDSSPDPYIVPDTFSYVVGKNYFFHLVVIEGDRRREIDIRPIKIASGENIVSLQYQPDTNLHGYVYNYQGAIFEPVVGARLRASTAEVVWTDENGFFAFNNIQQYPGPHYMSLTDESGQTFSNFMWCHFVGYFDSSVPWAPKAIGAVVEISRTKIFGHVYKKGTIDPIEGSTVEIYEIGSSTPLKTINTDNLGYYKFLGLNIDKDYSLIAKKDGYNDSEIKNVTVPSQGGDYEVNFELEPLDTKTVLLTWDMPMDEMGSPQEYGFEIRRMLKGAGSCENAEIFWTIDPLEEGLDEAGSAAGVFYDSTAQKGKTYIYCIYAFTRLGDWSAPTIQDVQIPNL